ncbi:NmrA family NAD(P)-binding protein [Kutzneria albida]|uniref:NmrA-like domain-containing protein n=1 Tax=Kutzneria albida DSM 43870 TaxID=1449976 RepID=W5WCY8_9PSEU|nr:NAD(P)H-binding protein [Kutzneria albida]AHH99043.1 hypothetical protein KALB_5682 [Kutzneria albida DSM 43870]
MYAITGASGRTGRSAALHLLERGHAVRVIGRSAERLADLADRGAEVREADQTDPDRMTAALRGATAAYAVVQPNYLPEHPDFGAFQDAVSASLAQAVADSGVPRVVGLSSWGGAHATGVGPVAGLHRFEERLRAVPAVRVHLLRPGYFMENLLGFADQVRAERRISAPFDPDVPLPLITTGDVGVAAAEELVKGDGPPVRELHGPRDVPMSEVVAVLGALLGQPVAYERIEVAEFHTRLLAAGIAGNVAAMMAEVPAAMNSRHLRTEQPRSAETTTPTSLEEFLRAEFLPLLGAMPAT